MIDGNDFIHLAGTMCVLSGAVEAHYRTAASRAYYGAFHLAQRFLDDLGVPVPRNENAHGFLQNQLLNSRHPDAASAGSLLRNLHQNRIKADYDLRDRRFEASDRARRLVESAHAVRRALDECKREPARSAVQAGIAEYQAKRSE